MEPNDPFMYYMGDSFAEGYEIVLMNELARMGEFTYEIHNYTSIIREGINPKFGPVSAEFLAERVRKYDIVLHGYWMQKPEYALQGAFSPYGIYDLSYVLIAKSAAKARAEKFMQFVEPFSADVWLALILSTLVTAIAYWIVESGLIPGVKENTDDFPKHHCYPIGQTFFLAFMQVTRIRTYSPKSWPGKLLVLSWSWFVLLFIAAYIAKLVSYLVSQSSDQLEMPSYESLDHAVELGARICASKLMSEYDWLQQQKADKFPSLKAVDIGHNAFDAFMAVQRGTCDAAIVTMMDWHKYQNNEQANKLCNMKVIGQPLNSLSGGFMVLNDFDETCTHMVREILNILFLELQSNGKLARIYSELQNRYYSRYSKKGCEIVDLETKKPESESLTLKNMMGGVFLIHGCFIVLSFGVAVRPFRKKCQRTKVQDRGKSAHHERQDEVLQRIEEIHTTVMLSKSSSGPAPEGAVDKPDLTFRKVVGGGGEKLQSIDDKLGTICACVAPRTPGLIHVKV